ncbi:MAG: hypothetical protein MJ168_10440 [Clostridia bacterium]|nr:hypothetical protein [Clostridia bacterium]
MGKILVIAENYLYSESPDTNCLRCVLNGIVDHGHEVVLFAPSYKGQVHVQEKFTVKYFYQKGQEMLDNRFGIKSHNKIISLLIAILGHFVVKSMTQKRKKEYCKEFERVNSGNEKFDCILSIYCPRISHQFAQYIVARNPETKWFLYFLDPHTYNQDYYSKKNTGTIRSRTKDEKSWAKYAYGVISSFGILEENARHNFEPYKKAKNLEVHLPNLEIKSAETQNIKNEDTTIRMVYTGRFYSDIRNPEPLIQLLKMLDKNSAIAEFYGSCCDYLKENYSILPKCIKLKDTVSQVECKEITDNADILINVGNKTLNQVPSKIFEYIGSGKPIINIYYSENDPSLKYLKKYPKIFNLRADKTPDLNKLNEFLSDLTPIPNEKLQEIYKDCISDNVVKKIIDFIEGCEKNV